jgi:TolB-like protein
MRHLSTSSRVRVLDAGDVREQLLRARVIMEGGISIADADVVGSVLEADYVLAGRVIDFRDFDGPEAVPRVEFSTVLVERASRRVVWSSQSDNTGGDGVVMFGRGATRTAHAMATQMVRITSDMITGAGR